MYYPQPFDVPTSSQPYQYQQVQVLEQPTPTNATYQEQHDMFWLSEQPPSMDFRFMQQQHGSIVPAAVPIAGTNISPTTSTDLNGVNSWKGRARGHSHSSPSSVESEFAQEPESPRASSRGPPPVNGIDKGSKKLHHVPSDKIERTAAAKLRSDNKRRSAQQELVDLLPEDRGRRLRLGLANQLQEVKAWVLSLLDDLKISHARIEQLEFENRHLRSQLASLSHTSRDGINFGNR